MATLKSILKERVGVDLEFVDLVKDTVTSADGRILPIVKLMLKNPIERVVGGTVSDGNGGSVTLEVYDVDLVTINPEALEEIDRLEEAGEEVFKWDVEGKSGRLKVDLKLDVSQREQVWITKTPFAQLGRQQRRNEQTGLAQRILERKTRKEFGRKTNPEPVE